MLAGQWRALAEALLPDAVEPLGRRKALERARWAAFDEPAGPDLDRFLALSRELEAMKVVADDFPLSDADRLAFFDALAERVRAIHAGEVKATNVLAEVVGPG